MLPNYQARSPFVLKHTTSMYVCGMVRMPFKLVRVEIFSPKNKAFLGLTPVYSETTALSKPYFILKLQSVRKFLRKCFQETKS